ncbi:methyl-accepting chemotaxis protein [Rhodocyclus tenuis]|uniref:Methyl-accepting chemotaxis protein n=1 Tax=Rhodocyclus gracilis TaxID=2929842 RepID=A0ABX0WH79_9RHOO|nr:methyl-accepting chemotaxis protein [Rhodocyclus gracilis]MRD73138.1 HAMP domain-containing protein [Rhodocyclus gracilis]NJA89082.1 methyl-accepting chemotaxis protein [Rhodocyclus gracilis]
MLDKFSVKTRLAFLVALLSVIMIVVGGVGLLSTEKVKDRLKTVYEDRTAALVQLSIVLDNLHRSRGRIWSAALEDDPARAAKEADGIGGFLATANKEWADYLATYLTPEEKVIAADFEKNYKQYLAAIEPLAVIAAKGDRAKAQDAMAASNFRKIFNDSREKLDELMKYQAGVAKSEYEAGIADYTRAQTLSISLIVVGLLLGIGLAWSIIRSITVPLGEALKSAHLIAQGDLSQPVPTGAKAELGQLLKAMSEMQVALKDVVGAIKRDANQLAETADRLADSSSEVAKASGMQSEASSAIAASVEEMTVSINHISARTTDTRDLTQQVGDLSESGMRTTEKTTEGVRTIASSVNQASTQIDALSKKIDQVAGTVGVINDIAEQTNLLALNAAIEAARAGEQGRGFAVVADEVRKLAERTTQSTQEIRTVIDEILAAASVSVRSMGQSVEQVATGVSLSEASGSAISQIKHKEGEVLAAVSEIAEALSEQSQASTDIAKQVERIAQATEENSAAITATAESSQNLNELGRSLMQTVSRFKT